MREHSRDKVRLVFSQQIDKYLSETDWNTWNNSDLVLNQYISTIKPVPSNPQLNQSEPSC